MVALQRQLVFLLIAGLLLIMALSQTPLGLPALGVMAASWLWHWSVVWQNRADNRPTLDTPVLPSLGIPNWLSIVRGLLNSVLLGLVAADPIYLGWWPAVLYTISALIDIFDGLVARLTKQMTRLGGTLDLEYDAAGVFIVVVVGLRLGQLPFWFVLIGLARYLYIAGIQWHERRKRPLYPTPDSHNRRVTAGLTMAYLTVILWPPVGATFSHVAAYVFGVPFLIGFLRDWLIATGLIDVEQATYQQGRRFYKQLTEYLMPQIGRIIAIGLIATQQITLDFTTPPAWFGVVGVLMVAVGVIPRLGAVFLIVPAVLGGGVLGPSLALLVCALVTVQHGLRRYALWTPEELIFEKRLG